MSAAPELAFEDLTPGRVFVAGPAPITAEAIVAFARAYDPQPFHLDAEAAKATPLGGLAASGVHTGAVGMRLMCDALLGHAAGLGAPGLDDLRWLKPVRPGMALSLRLECVGARASRSRPDVGLVAQVATLSDETGEPVMTQRFTALFARRNPGAPFVDSGAAPPSAARAPDPPALEDAAANESRFAPYLDDVQIGARVALGSHRFERAAMIDFARAYDPQPFHLSDEAAAASHFGRLAASGWMTFGVATRLMVATRERLRAGADAPLGPSPGVRDLRWLRPVYADDVVSFDTVAMGKRDAGKPGWGYLLARSRGVNQAGTQVYEASNAYMVPKRP